jgi:hypothetical protein
MELGVLSLLGGLEGGGMSAPCLESCCLVSHSTNDYILNLIWFSFFSVLLYVCIVVSIGWGGTHPKAFATGLV